VDGGSTDGTLEVLREQRVRYESGPDAGLYDALSKGVRMARGEFVNIMDADDWYAHRSVLSSVVAAMTAWFVPGNPRYVVGTGLLEHDELVSLQLPARRLHMLVGHRDCLRHQGIDFEGIIHGS